MSTSRALLVALVLAACSPAPPVPAAAPREPAPHAQAAQSAPEDVGPRPPLAKRDQKTTTVGGLTLVDDYFWMRNKGAPDVVAYLEAENAYAAAMTKATEPLQKTLYDEMLGRLVEDDASPPIKDGAWLYY